MNALLRSSCLFLRKIRDYLLYKYDKGSVRFHTWRTRRYWLSMKGKHQGERGFVIGNGPSLKIEDLEKLKHEVTFASNKIYLAFDQVAWRPSYYTIGDPIVWDKIKHEVGRYFECIHIPSFFRKIPRCLLKNIVLWKHLNLSKKAPKGAVGFSEDASRGLYPGGTITYQNLQLAVHMGLNPIYIIGCDHFYQGEEKQNKSEPIQVEKQDNHFIKGYRKPGEIVHSANISMMTTAYQKARSGAEKNGIKIFNATRGGYLEVFERIEWDSLF